MISSTAHAAPSEDAAQALAASDWAQAIKLSKRGGKDAETRLMVAVALLEQGKSRQALRKLRSLERKLPHLADMVRYLRGRAFAKRRKHRHAAEQFKRCIETKGSRWVDSAREARALSLLAAKRARAAAIAFRILLRDFKHHPRRTALELGQARAWLLMGRWQSAADQLRRIWLEQPHTKQAEVARRLLNRLKRRRGRRIKLPSLDVPQLYERARVLRRFKRYKAAIAQLRSLARKYRAERHRVALAIAYVQWKQQRPRALLRTLKPLLKSKSPSLRRSGRRLAVQALGWLGHVDQAYALFEEDMPRTDIKEISGTSLKALGDAARFLAEHGRYKQALPLYRRLAATMKWSRKTRRKLAWVAYRAGDYATALNGFTQHFKHQPVFATYWQARTHEKAGRPQQAERLYRQLVEQHMRSYYGHLARAHLVRAKKIVLEKQQCKHFRGPVHGDLLKVIKPLIAEHGALFPELKRVQSLWRIGMRTQARRELRVLLARYTWALYRGRKLTFRLRQFPLRIWAGRKLKHQNFWSRESRSIRKLRFVLSPKLGELAYAAGVDYFGWRLSPPHKNAVKRVFPRAYDQLVRRAAKNNGLDPNLIWAIMYTESRYRPDVISRVNAGGLMQLMPNTARLLARELGVNGFRGEDVFEPTKNLRLSMHYLKAVLDKFKGQVRLAAAGYNGGPHNVARWLTIRGKGAASDEFIEEIPFAESKRYAKKIIRMISLYERTHCNKDDMVVSNDLETRFLPKPTY